MNSYPGNACRTLGYLTDQSDEHISSPQWFKQMIPIKNTSPWHSGFSHLHLVIGDFVGLDMKAGI